MAFNLTGTLGYDLKHVKHYATTDNAVDAVVKRLSAQIQAGVVFNLMIVPQADLAGGVRHVPVLSCFRAPATYPGGDLQAMMNCGIYGGFVCYR